MLVKKRIPGDRERERLRRAEEIYSLPPVMLCLSATLSLAGGKTQERSDCIAHPGRPASL